MTKRESLNGKPYAGNPHVRFDEGEAASTATPRLGLYSTYGKTSQKVLVRHSAASGENGMIDWFYVWFFICLKVGYSLLYVGLLANGGLMYNLSHENNCTSITGESYV